MTFLKNNPPASAYIAGVVKCSSNVAAPKPARAISSTATTSQVGDVTNTRIDIATHSWTVPSGGTWWVWYFSGGEAIYQAPVSAIVAGGTTLTTVANIYGFAWRIQ